MSKIVLIDGHSILNRAFFGLPDLTNAEGLHTNAIYGFLNIMFKILEEEKPEYLTVAFDVHAPTFRHKMFEAYKGTRKPMAEELRQQVPLMNSISIERESGRSETTIWLNDAKLVLSIEKAIDMLQQIELYALACYHTTQGHIKAINQLETKEEIEAYNFKTGYPGKLSFFG